MLNKTDLFIYTHFNSKEKLLKVINKFYLDPLKKQDEEEYIRESNRIYSMNYFELIDEFKRVVGDKFKPMIY